MTKHVDPSLKQGLNLYPCIGKGSANHWTTTMKSQQCFKRANNKTLPVYLAHVRFQKTERDEEVAAEARMDEGINIYM